MAVMNDREPVKRQMLIVGSCDCSALWWPTGVMVLHKNESTPLFLTVLIRKPNYFSLIIKIQIRFRLILVGGVFGALCCDENISK